MILIINLSTKFSTLQGNSALSAEGLGLLKKRFGE